MKTRGIFALSPFLNFIIKLAEFYALFFFCCRLLFCYFNVPTGNHEHFADFSLAFFRGFRFDLMIISYVLMLPALLLFCHQTFLKKSHVLPVLVNGYLWIVTFLVFFITCADIPYFSQFGNHFNKAAFAWNLTPGYILRLVFSDFFYWGFLLLFLVFFIAFVFFLNRIAATYRKDLAEEEQSTLFRSSAHIVVLVALLLLSARGRLSFKSPMHEGMAIVGQNAFVNQVALNPNFTLMKSLSRRNDSYRQPDNIHEDLKVCSGFFKHNYFPSGGAMPVTNGALTPADSINKLNVVVVLMESMNMSKMGYYGHKNLSPYLTRLAGESVFFDRFFSSGIHTFNGLFSSVSGFPSIYTEQGLRQYTRQPFITLGNLLKPYGYYSFFCATHDPVFDNMEGFFRLNGFDHIISSNDFNDSESIGLTGVPDHKLYKKLIEHINANGKEKPFVAYVMTGSDHGPWTIPPGIDFKPDGTDEKERASQYADWAVQQFIEDAKKESWYNNTVFVFFGDHGQFMDDVYEMPITYHHTPLIVHCPKLLTPEVKHNLGYQPDLVKTIASLLHVRYTNFSFGVNIMEEQRPFVFFSADDKLGMVTDDDFFFYHLLNTGQKRLVKYRSFDTKDYYPAYAHRADSLYNVAQSLYSSAQYYIHNTYFSF